MKKLWILVFAVLLSGCAAEQTFETISDVWYPEETQLSEIVLPLPEEAAEAVVQADGTSVYACDGYELTLEVLPGGSIDQTMQTISGLSPERLSALETHPAYGTRYDLTWCAESEQGEQISRAAVLDDGCTHYCLTATASAADVSELTRQWNALFQSFALASY